MTNKMQVFNYKDKEVRTVENEKGTWWVLKDVCNVLDIKNSRDIVSRLDNDESGVDSIDTLGGKQNMSIINESGLYSVILRSDKPQAKPFRKWVTCEVLPSIRKHGAYMTDGTLEKALLSPDFLIQIAQSLKAEREKTQMLTETIHIKNQLITEYKPKADYMDTILKNKSLVTITQIAKDYGLSGRAMNTLLFDYKVQFKQSGQWLLYAKHQKLGYTHSKTVNIQRSNGEMDVVMETKWTQKGRLFIYNLLKKDDILPVIEQGNFSYS